MKRLLFFALFASVLITVSSCKKAIRGCTNPSATNYNSKADEDDGSCKYPAVVYGCTDPSATNYNQYATVNNGSCTYTSTPACQINNTGWLVFSSTKSNPYDCYVNSVYVGRCAAGSTLSVTRPANSSYSLRALQYSGYAIYPSDYTTTSGALPQCYSITWTF